ncbi:MAG: undecaprenyl-diphosphate phosphatase [Phycisphaerae bacterium]|nr:undecaprenyl-diphosphate phosphatase [Phycisphaerae bacterium]
MELWQAIVLGLVEGITEYLPVSSTGHLILASWLLGLGGPERKAAIDAFNIVVQGGAVLAVLGLYWPRVVAMLLGLLGKNPAGRRLFVNLCVAFVPAAVIGKLFNDAIEARLFSAWPVIAALALGGVYMILLQRTRGNRGTREIDDLRPRDALVVGLLQCAALWPGTSRSMMTITGGYLVGLRPRAAAEFSFLLALPTLGAATAFRLYKDLAAARQHHTPAFYEVLGVLPTIIGVVVAAVSAALAVRWLVGFLNRRGLEPFGWYRLGLAGLLAAVILSGALAAS